MISGQSPGFERYGWSSCVLLRQIGHANRVNAKAAVIIYTIIWKLKSDGDGTAAGMFGNFRAAA
jgi:hypothetical protein